VGCISKAEPLAFPVSHFVRAEWRVKAGRFFGVSPSCCHQYKSVHQLQFINSSSSTSVHQRQSLTCQSGFAVIVVPLERLPPLFPPCSVVPGFLHCLRLGFASACDRGDWQGVRRQAETAKPGVFVLRHFARVFGSVEPTCAQTCRCGLNRLSDDRSRDVEGGIDARGIFQKAGDATACGREPDLRLIAEGAPHVGGQQERDGAAARRGA